MDPLGYREEEDGWDQGGLERARGGPLVLALGWGWRVREVPCAHVNWDHQ